MNLYVRQIRESLILPLLFKYKSYIFLIARRNLSDNGFYDVAEEGSHFDRYLKNQIEYWNKPKRCSVWLIRRFDSGIPI